MGVKAISMACLRGQAVYYYDTWVHILLYFLHLLWLANDGNCSVACQSLQPGRLGLIVAIGVVEGKLAWFRV
jgi:hypothetical protein